MHDEAKHQPQQRDRQKDTEHIINNSGGPARNLGLHLHTMFIQQRNQNLFIIHHPSGVISHTDHILLIIFRRNVILGRGKFHTLNLIFLYQLHKLRISDPLRGHLRPQLI